MTKFRKKPVVIDAMQLPPSDEPVSQELIDFLHSGRDDVTLRDCNGGVAIYTPEGVMRGDPGDWIIRGVKGEIYPCKPDVFESTYEAV